MQIFLKFNFSHFNAYLCAKFPLFITLFIHFCHTIVATIVITTITTVNRNLINNF